MDTIITIKTLNADDSLKSHGELLGTDGQGNSLYLFCGELVANRFRSDDGEILWSSDEESLEGWGYDRDSGLADDI